MYRNGLMYQGVPWEIVEASVGVYTFSFVNDGVDKTTWHVIIQHIIGGDVVQESWYVQRPTAELNAVQIRSRLDGEGGIFG